MFPEAKPRGTLMVEGKQNSLFPEGPCGRACSTSGSQSELTYRNDTITVLFFAANKNKDNTKIALPCANA